MKSTIRTAALACAIAATASTASWAQDPEERADGSWISISGEVVSAADNSFLLNYGEGQITVEMDDWDWYQEGKALKEGDSVTVFGRVDNDLYQTTTIEASSVYVENLGTYFYASAADEEDPAFVVVTTPVVVARMDLTGTVTGVDGREFTLDTGERQLTVDTSQMPYDPMDDEGYQKITEGTQVRVSGTMDYDLFEKRELMANTIITLTKDKTKTSG